MLGVVLVVELLGGSYLVFCGFCGFVFMLFDYLVLVPQVPFSHFLGGRSAIEDFGIDHSLLRGGQQVFRRAKRGDSD